MNQRKKVAFLGGSFDPPHNGHIALGESVVQRGLVDEVWLAPAWVPPHKSRTLTAFEKRCRMVELAVGECSKLQVCTIEGELQLNPSYTIEVLEALGKRYPEIEFSLLIGGDMLTCFHSWYRATELLDKYEVLIYPRLGESSKKEELLQYWSEEQANRLSQRILEDLPFFDISSTNIRKKLVKAQNATTVINERVIEYIKQAGLYSAKENELDE